MGKKHKKYGLPFEEAPLDDMDALVRSIYGGKKLPAEAVQDSSHQLPPVLTTMGDATYHTPMLTPMDRQVVQGILSDKAIAPSAPAAPRYGALNVKIATSFPGSCVSMIISDHNGNSVARPVLKRGDDPVLDKRMNEMDGVEFQSMIIFLYTLMKLKFYPDAVFTMDGAGLPEMLDTFKCIDLDNVLSFYTGDRVESFIVDMDVIDAFGDQISYQADEAGINILGTIARFIPMDEFPGEDYHPLIGKYVDMDAFRRNNAEFIKYCKDNIMLPRDSTINDITSIDDITDDYDTIYATMVNAFDKIYYKPDALEKNENCVYADATPTDDEKLSGGLTREELEALTAAHQFPAEDDDSESEGVSNDNEPFRGSTDAVVHADDTTRGNKPEDETRDTNSGSNTGVSSNTKVDVSADGGQGNDAVSDDDNASDRIREDTKCTNNAGNDRSPSIGTSLGDVLKNAGIDAPNKEEKEPRQSGGSSADGKENEAETQTSIKVTGSNVNEGKQKEKEVTPSDGKLVIPVRNVNA